MGDRGNIVLKYDNGSDIYFYTHWRGSDLFEILQQALAKGRDRWSDETYLARIIFCEMVGDDDGITGFGISPYITDNEHELVYVLLATQEVEIGNKNWSFEQFIEARQEEVGS